MFDQRNWLAALLAFHAQISDLHGREPTTHGKRATSCERNVTSSCSRRYFVNQGDAFQQSLPFEVRARFCGVLDWLCPSCGYLNRSTLVRTAWRVQCKAKPCRRWFAVGMVFHSLGSLQHAGRPSLPPPDVTFPRAELSLSYRRGDPVHRVIRADEDTPVPPDQEPS